MFLQATEPGVWSVSFIPIHFLTWQRHGASSFTQYVCSAIEFLPHLSGSQLPICVALSKHSTIPVLFTSESIKHGLDHHSWTQPKLGLVCCSSWMCLGMPGTLFARELKDQLFSCRKIAFSAGKQAETLTGIVLNVWLIRGKCYLIPEYLSLWLGLLNFSRLHFVAFMFKMIASSIPEILCYIFILL